MIYVGIDISKSKYDCAAVDKEGNIVCPAWSFQKNQEGFNNFATFLHKIGKDIRIGFEATGHYGANIKLLLNREKYDFMECNPLSVKEFVRSKSLRRTKTDAIDAVYIALYLRSLEENDYRPNPKNFYSFESLKSLTRFRYSIVRERSLQLVRLTNILDNVFPEYKAFFKNRLGTTALYILEKYGSPEKIANMNFKSYDMLRRVSYGSFKTHQFAELKQLAYDTVGKTNELLQIQLSITLGIYRHLNARVEYLDNQIQKIIESINPPCFSIKGIGHISAAVIISEYGDFSRFNSVDKMLSFAGLDPCINKSGKIDRKGKMVKHGSSYLRYTLINAVMPVILNNVVFAEYYRKKRTEGKPDLVAKSHIAKKLVRIIYTLHKQNVLFDPDKLR